MPGYRLPGGGARTVGRFPGLVVEQAVGGLLGPAGHLPDRQPEQGRDPGGVVVLRLDPPGARF